jgi:hypothetical protein
MIDIVQVLTTSGLGVFSRTERQEKENDAACDYKPFISVQREINHQNVSLAMRDVGGQHKLLVVASTISGCPC